MQGLSNKQIKRQDFVDNKIYGLLKRLIPASIEIEWDIGRNVPRPASSGISEIPCPPEGRKRHYMNDHTFPGSVAFGREASDDR